MSSSSNKSTLVLSETDSEDYLKPANDYCLAGSKIIDGRVFVEEIFQQFDQASRDDQKCRARYRDDFIDQLKREKMQLGRESTCHPYFLDKNLGNIDTRILREYQNSEFDNFEVTELSSCVQEHIFYSFSEPDGQLPIGTNVPNWYQNLQRIGEESVAGMVYKFDLRQGKDFGIIKVPRKPGDDEFIHELFVGKYGTNLARKEIPNFSFVYGGFLCTPTVAGYNDDKGVVSMCSGGKNEVFYVVYEYIPGPSVEKATENMSKLNWVSIISQIAFTTLYATHKFDWTHYDLHAQNVLLRQISPEFKAKRGIENEFMIRYPIGGEDYYVKSTEIATIIDYGRSHIKYNGQNYGYLFPAAGINPIESNPMFDIFKFLMMTARAFHRNQNFECLNICSYLASFFIEDYIHPSDGNLTQFIKLIKDLGRTYYNLPATNLSVTGFITHLLQIDPDRKILSQTNTTKLPVIGCKDNDCAGPYQLMEDVISKSDMSVIDYYFTIRKAESESERFTIKLPSASMYKEHILYSYNLMDNYNVLMNNYRKISPEIEQLLKSFNFETMIYTLDTLNIIKKFLSTVAGLIYTYNRIYTYISASMLYLNDVILVDRDQWYVNELEITRNYNNKQIVSAKTDINYIYNSARDLIDGIEATLMLPYSRKMMKDDNRFLYYKNVVPTII